MGLEGIHRFEILPAEAGCTTLHFGRTDNHQAGLMRFKRSWGATEEPICYTRFDVRAGEWLRVSSRPAGMSSHLLKKLPLTLNRIAGSLVYRYLAF